MVTYVSLLVVYVVGGLTFVPLLLLVVFCHAYLTQPVVDPSDIASRGPSEEDRAAEKTPAKDELAGLPPGVSPRAHEPDVAAGYFAVCREYVPGGVNGKAPDRPGAASSVVATESPSVYQSMYRSIFERGKTSSPSLDGARGSKKTSNVFFVVLRLGHLMLYDDAEQLEVRHVISLSHYDIDVYSGGEPIPEGELWVKRNCIRLSRKPGDNPLPSDTKPFFLFSNSCSEKEDFYHALLQNQARDRGPGPSPLPFEHDHMIKLIRQLHTSEDNMQTRWFNALIGRMFLSVYKTSLVEDLVRKKITKKLSRVVKPAFISSIQIRKIYLGDGAPFITNPKLKELTIPGDLTIEADMRYKGNARIDVAAVARIDLGPRFKAREVELLLAVICKSVEGHVMFRVKPPPSNRIWFSFEQMPKLDLSIEPVVSSRQITYGLVLRAIESRIREVIGDTLVYPNWDDAPFTDTLDDIYRGGIWSEDSASDDNARFSAAPTLVNGGDEIPMQEDESPGESVQKVIAEQPVEALMESQSPKPFKRKTSRSNSTTEGREGAGFSTGSEIKSPGTPKGLRSNSFATAASPIVTRDAAVTEALKALSRERHQDAASAMKDISSRSQPITPTESPVGTPPKTTVFNRKGQRSMSSTSAGSVGTSDLALPESLPTEASAAVGSRDVPEKDSDDASVLSELSSLGHRPTQPQLNQKRQALTLTAAAAKKWGLDFVSRHSPSASVSSVQSLGEPDPEIQPEVLSSTMRSNSLHSSKESVGPGTKAFGRGQPLPPPGQPLPGPAKPGRMTWTGPLGILGRKKADSISQPSSSVPNSPAAAMEMPRNDSDPDLTEPPALPQRPTEGGRSTSMEDLVKGSSIPRRIARQKGQPTTRKTLQNGSIKRKSVGDAGSDDSLLVIKAPDVDPEADAISSNGDDDSTLFFGSPQQATEQMPQLVESPIKEQPEDIARTSSSSVSSADMHPLPERSFSASSDRMIPRPELKVRRSRQSLIPTPSSSRKHSPAEKSTDSGGKRSGSSQADISLSPSSDSGNLVTHWT